TCAIVDVSDSLDPKSLASAGVELERILWVRCGEPAAGVAVKKNVPAAARPRETAPNFAKEKVKREAGGWTHPRDSIRGIENAIPSVMGNLDKSKKFSWKVNAAAPVAQKEASTLVAHTDPAQRLKTGNHFSRKSNGKNKPWKKLEQALKVTDLLLHAGGWGVV